MEVSLTKVHYFDVKQLALHKANAVRAKGCMAMLGGLGLEAEAGGRRETQFVLRMRGRSIWTTQREREREFLPGEICVCVCVFLMQQ